MADYREDIKNILLKEKNIILRGAPGTGKTYLAHEIASILVGSKKDERDRIGFVQFHPGYDYTDFVEGIRPVQKNEKMGFELKSGIFMEFVEKAIKSQFDDAWEEFLNAVKGAGPKGYNGVEGVNNLIPYEKKGDGVYVKESTTYLSKNQIYRVYRGLPGVKMGGHDSYRKHIVDKLKKSFFKNDKKYVFIIDEINRGEISNIFGELFFSIDPNYRGDTQNAISTQYSNLHSNEDFKFFIPNNVYIIGTMNDIDRSVDTFDFAMRRRFSFIEVTAEESAAHMLKNEKLRSVVNKFNEIIGKDLSRDYQIGASYFKVLDASSDEKMICGI
ncbi:McrB family protein [Companilactobacillus suantsaicola]|uniref:McrB family protein n=1 Tax=Companilactobacillus suantsaicola TaxID=2487723 RepID=UPI001436875C|nr:AAA family ATPase [Companilactobacillus suantsaicola]